jgi:hypothetical protein
VTATPPPRSFSEVLNLLLESQAREDPKNPGTFVPPTNTEVAEAINGKFGPGSITGEYVRRLRKGDIKSPSVQAASLLAAFFGLPLDVFNATGSETSKKVMEEVQRLTAYRRRTLDDEAPTVAVLARAARRLSPAGQKRVVQYAQRLEEIEDMERGAGEPLTPASD